jgi:hypothetical protein
MFRPRTFPSLLVADTDNVTLGCHGWTRSILVEARWMADGIDVSMVR